MKTVEAWYEEWPLCLHGVPEKVIKQIQLDAYKQGMTDAAEIAEGIAAPSFQIRKARDAKQSI